MEVILCRHWIRVWKGSRRSLDSEQKGNIHLICWKSKFWYDSRLFHHIFSFGRKIAKIDHVCLSVLPSAWNSWAPTGNIFVNFYIGLFFQNIHEFCYWIIFSKYSRIWIMDNFFEIFTNFDIGLFFPNIMNFDIGLLFSKYS